MNFSELCKFQPKQIEAYRALEKHTFLLYGGAAGGGKSYFLRWAAVYLGLKWAKELGIQNGSIGLFCEDYPSLKDRQISKIRYEFPPWLGDLSKSDNEFRIDPKWGGWTIAFRNLDDPSKYLSAEFAAIFVDELTRNDRAMFDFLNMRRRWPGIKDTKFVGATNPGGIGHAWVKKLWIDRDFSEETLNPKDFAFVSAKATDNKYLGEEYDKQLAQLPPALRKAYRDGDWDVFAGQFFSEWSKAKHVSGDMYIPEGWSRIRCLDYGFKKPSACYWLAIDFDGRIYVYRELYATGLTYGELARKIVEMTPEEEEIEYTVADTSMFAKTADTGEFGQDIMADNGVPITPGNKDRIAGWNLMRKYLKNEMIVFHPSCKNAIATIPALVYTESKTVGKVEDLDTAGEDHAADALRYGLMSLPPLPDKLPNRIENPYENDPDSPWFETQNVGTYKDIYR